MCEKCKVLQKRIEAIEQQLAEMAAMIEKLAALLDMEE